MTLAFEDLRVLKEVEGLADDVWMMVSRWGDFERDTVGKQLARSIDSIGANVAESFGRYHYGEKLQFLYCACGSVFESKYWLKRVLSRDLAQRDQTELLIERVGQIAKQVNALAKSTKKQRKSSTKLREPSPEYMTVSNDLDMQDLFSPKDLKFITTTADHDN